VKGSVVVYKTEKLVVRFRMLSKGLAVLAHRVKDGVEFVPTRYVGGVNSLLILEDDSIDFEKMESLFDVSSALEEEEG
jgi:hypothetical protein